MANEFSLAETQPEQPNPRETWRSFALEPTTKDALHAMLLLSGVQTATQAASTYINDEISEDKAGPILSAEELNRRFPGEKFERDERLEVAKRIASRNESMRILQSTIDGYSAGDKTKWGMNFGVAMFAHASDPLELLSGMGVGAALGGAANAFKSSALAGRSAFLARNATRIGRLLQPVDTTGMKFAERLAAQATAQEFTRSAVEGFLGNVVTEPIVMLNERHDQRQYTAMDAIYNAGAAALGIGALRYAGGKATARLLKHWGYSNAAGRTVMSQMIQDQMPRLHSLEDAQRAEESGRIDIFGAKPIKFGPQDTVTRDFTYRAIDNETLPENTPLFIGREASGKTLNQSLLVDHDTPHGNHWVMTDNINTANARVSSFDFQNVGRMFKVMLKQGTRLFNLDRDGAELWHSIVGKYGLKVKEPPKGITVAQVLDDVKKMIAAEKLPNNALVEISGYFKQLGYHGYHQRMDNDGNPHNVITIFDRSSFDKKGSALGTRHSIVPDKTKLHTEMNAQRAPENQLWHDPKAESEGKKYESVSELQEQGSNEYTALTNQLKESLEERAKMGDDVGKELETLKRGQALEEERNMIYKTAMQCVFGAD